MADEVVVDWITWSRFSKSTERIEVKNISLESFSKAQDNLNICLPFVRTFAP